MAVTIKDIARIADVSHTTVSRALRNHPAVAEETVARIRQIANDLGYVPNTVARGLKTSRSRVMGVIVRRIVDPFLSEVLNGIEDVLQAAGYSLFLAASKRDPEREKSIIRTMSEHRVDGVIICSTEVGASHLAQLTRLRVPHVLLNNQAAGETAVLSVSHDDMEGCRQLTQHLLDLGHVHIGYMGNSNGGKTNDDRRAGFRRALQAANVEIDAAWIFDAPNGQPKGGVMGADYFLSQPHLTALVCFNDMMAIGAMQTLHRAGRRVPADCSVVGFDNIEMAAFAHPPLTTFHQPKFELGQTAARLMLEALQNRESETVENGVHTLLGSLQVRGSTGPPQRL